MSILSSWSTFRLINTKYAAYKNALNKDNRAPIGTCDSREISAKLTNIYNKKLFYTFLFIYWTNKIQIIEMHQTQLHKKKLLIKIFNFSGCFSILADNFFINE